MLYPLTFQPLFKERLWGGRNLEQLYGKALPPQVPIGESWEITDRPGDVSVIANGPLAGKDLHWLIENHAPELYGASPPATPRFPLLIKIIDAQDKLSLQVHPSVEVASRLGSEPKTELWYIAQAGTDARLFAGLKKGVTREEFERKLQAGTVAECVHEIPVKAEDAILLPSGRLHAIGAGLTIFEIQQNSDTTYRVFDWNRVDLDGRPRALHITESLASINFQDFEPRLISSIYSRNPRLKIRFLVDQPLFRVDAFKVKREHWFHLRSSELYLVGMLKGRLRINYRGQDLLLNAGQFALLPACLERTGFYPETQVEFLQVRLGEGQNAK